MVDHASMVLSEVDFGFWRPGTGPAAVSVRCGRCGFQLMRLHRPEGAATRPSWTDAELLRWVREPHGNDASQLTVEPDLRPGTFTLRCGGRRCRGQGPVWVSSEVLARKVERAVRAGARRVIWGDGAFQRSHG